MDFPSINGAFDILIPTAAIKIQTYPEAFVILLAIFFTIARIVIQSSTLRLLPFTSLKPDKYRKFSESVWKICFYGPSWLWCVKEIAVTDWFPDLNAWWSGYPNVEFPLSFQYLYLTELAYYLHCLVTHGFLEVKRGDYWQMFAHHAVAVLLIIGSWTAGYHRVGGVLFLLHDLLDIILESGKLWVYLEYTNVANCWFIALISVWVYCRIYLFGTKLIMGSLAGLPVVGDTRPVWNALFVLLMVLLSLNVYWWYLMLRVAHRTIFNKSEITDVREDEKKKE